MTIDEFNEKYELSILEEKVTNYRIVEEHGGTATLNESALTYSESHDMRVAVYDKLSGEEVFIQRIGCLEDVPTIIRQQFSLQT